MCIFPEKYRRLLRPLVFLAFLFLYIPLYPQTRSANDTVPGIPPVATDHILNNLSVAHGEGHSGSPLVLLNTKGTVQTHNFYDSLEVKASRGLITSKLYDFIIVRRDVASTQKNGRSDELYLGYTGKKIRKIEIQRLDVFGTDINDPLSGTPNHTEALLNKTHANTIERIIRKNLLIKEGDTISPLTLSDNERILRELSFIDDARIVIVPVSDDEADIIVLTKDVYSLGGSYSYKGLHSGTASVFEKNILGLGHEIGVDIPFNTKVAGSPGFGIHYLVNNMWKSFVNLNMFYSDGLGEKKYGFNLDRKFVSSTTIYAGGISVMQRFTSTDLDTLAVPAPLKYNLQDYWLARSFLANREKVSRIIVGVRYINNNVYERPNILPDSYYPYQRYRMYLGSVTYSMQKYHKANLIYSYGRTEDIPYGGLFRITAGTEYNEFNQFNNRTYIGYEAALGKSVNGFGYLYSSAGLATFINGHQPRQGILTLNFDYFSNLLPIGKSKIRNFINLDYIRGFDRNTDEKLNFARKNGFSGFRNDSIGGTQRLTFNLESVIFSPVNLIGFKFAFFGFTELSFLSGSNEIIDKGYSLTSIGMGIRIRNDNMVFNTLQIRLSFFPNAPDYSQISQLMISGEQLLKPKNFETGAPSLIQFR
jgi:hypothetical protein